MKRALSLLGAFLFALLPSPLKIALLRARGVQIGRGCYIDCSIINALKMQLGDYVRIGQFNLLHRLSKLEMASGSKIESLNWITGAGKGWLRMGRNSSIRRLHFFEASGGVNIGENTVIAGRSSLFFTHGQTPDNFEDVRPIEIGSWCYIGAAVRFVPGTRINDYSFVAMGTVVVKSHNEKFVVIGGTPGRVLKTISPDAAYYNRKYLRHLHHPSGWSN